MSGNEFYEQRHALAVQTFHLLAVSYSKCTKVLDYHQINLLLEQWGAENVVAL